jgi:hypothetical protein
VWASTLSAPIFEFNKLLKFKIRFKIGFFMVIFAAKFEI